MPKVTVIMPVYNAEKYVEEAINSVLNQTFKGFELIIVNDCSTDNSKEVIEKTIANDNRADNNLFENLKKAGEKTVEELNSKHHGILSDGEAIIAACSVMIRKKVFDKCKFDETMRNIEDYDIWYRIIGHGFKLQSINKNFYYYRVHENQKSKDPTKKQKAKNIIFNRIVSGEYFKN